MWGVSGTGPWILSLCFLFYIRYTTAVETNRTIDDEFGDSVSGQKPIFLPTTTGIWEGETCTGCRFQPDRAVAFKGTWNAATFRPEEDGGSGPISFDLAFKGTAIYVFFIAANQIAGGIITTLMECNFTLDGQHAGFFQHIPNTSQGFDYNVLAFKRTGLRNVDHTVQATAGGVNYHLLLNFDYAIYTSDDTPDPVPATSIASSSQLPAPSGTPSSNLGESSHKPPLGAILGGTIGGLAAILGVVVLLCIFRHRRDRRKSPGLPLYTNSAAQYDTTSIRERPQGFRDFTRNVRTNPSVSLPPWSSRINNKKSPINPPGPDVDPTFTEYTSTSDDTTTGGGVISTNSQPSSSAYTDASRRARQIQLENQLRTAEEELRDMGIEPRRGPPGPNVPPEMLRTSVYIEYRRLQGEMEEPPPQYSE